MRGNTVSDIRPARPQDAAFMVPLVAESSGGVWPAMWHALARDGESTDAAGERYLADVSNDLSVRNAVVAASGTERLGMMIAYQEQAPATAADTDSGLDPMLLAALAPYRELRDPDSLFIAELCCLPRARGQGLGGRLLAHAYERAAGSGLGAVSLRVFSENTGARRLYERSGFEVAGERAVIPHPAIRVGGSVLLMVRAV